MPIKNGVSAKVAQFVQKHPGCTRAQIMQAFGIEDKSWAIPTYAAKSGLIWPAGPHSRQRYYPTSQEAEKAHQSVCAEVAEERKRKKRALELKWNLKKRMERHAKGKRVLDTMHRFKLDPGVTISPNVKITIAKPIPDRWAA